ncbi:Amino acid/polyamine transporter I [Penicillium brevicompactum]|uniref:Amino acid/polyamine transporter I n=1 Tax=Penicillium brevicompactum TaxID=5074 RepID=A0A9W9R351_PENBR|nr:Amino acid/polyamine transporter I [Penicillium brevicompactum]
MESSAQDPEHNDEITNREDEQRDYLKGTPMGEDNSKTQAVISELDNKKRGLKQRHIQMIALAGTIGTGLFLATGKSLARGGPLSMLIAYALVGMLICCVVFSVAELSALAPLSGGIIRHAEWFVDPALSFAQGWNSVYANAILLPAEMVACAVIIDFWSDINHAVWISVLGGLLVLTNMLLVSIYGELEFIFAMMKIALIIGVNIMSICITSGAGPQGYTMGFRFWHDPGPFVQFLGIPGSWGQFLGFWRVLSSAAYAFSNVENISVAAAETQNPRYNIPKAAQRVFWRILIFYMITIFMMGLIVASNDKGLLSDSGDAGASPFRDCGHQCRYQGGSFNHQCRCCDKCMERWKLWTLYGLAQEGHAPKVLTRLNRFGVPWLSVAAVGSFLALGYMTLSSAASVVFDWLQELVSAASLVHWINIEIIYLRFYYGCKKQNIDRAELPWKSPFQPYAAWIALVGFAIILITGGFYVFIDGNWSPETFVSSYFNIPLIFILYFGYKFWQKTRLVPLDEIPIRGFLQLANESPETIPPQATGWRRINILWG